MIPEIWTQRRWPCYWFVFLWLIVAHNCGVWLFLPTQLQFWAFWFPSHDKSTIKINIQHAFYRRRNCNLLHQCREHGHHALHDWGLCSWGNHNSSGSRWVWQGGDDINLMQPLQTSQGFACWHSQGSWWTPGSHCLWTLGQVIRLTIAAQVARFYEDTGRELDLANMLWSVIKRFDEQFKALTARKKGEYSYVPPKLTKSFSTH